MKFKKYTPPATARKELLNNITDADYAADLVNVENTGKKGAIIRGILSAAAMFVIAVSVVTVALVGREMFHRGNTLSPADDTVITAPDGENFVFIEGTFVGTVKDGAYNNDGFYTGRTFAQLLAHDCLYADDGTVYREIYFNTVYDYEGYYSDLEKYATEIGTDYIKFTLPTVISEGDAALKCIPRDAAVFFDEQRNDSGIVCTFPVKIKPLESYSTQLTDDEKRTLYDEYDITFGLVDALAYSADFNGDGSEEKLVKLCSSSLSSSTPFNIVCILNKEEIKHIIRESGFSQLPECEIATILDIDINGSFEFVLKSQTVDKLSYVMYGYGGQVFEPVEKEITTVGECFYMFNDLLIENVFSDEVVISEWYEGHFGEPITRHILSDMTNSFFKTFKLKAKSFDLPDSLDKDSLTKYINKVGDNLYIDLPDDCKYAIINGCRIDGDGLTRLIKYIEDVKIGKLSVRPVATGGDYNSIGFYTDNECVPFEYTQSALMTADISYALPTEYLTDVYEHNRDFSGDVSLTVGGEKIPLSEEDAGLVRSLISVSYWKEYAADLDCDMTLTVGKHKFGYCGEGRSLTYEQGHMEMVFSVSERLHQLLNGYIN